MIIWKLKGKTLRVEKALNELNREMSISRGNFLSKKRFREFSESLLSH